MSISINTPGVFLETKSIGPDGPLAGCRLLVVRQQACYIERVSGTSHITAYHRHR